ncbi:helix-turn-helix domain-containing protein [Lactococcus lactis]
MKEYRLNLKLTGATLANLAGINQPYLSQIENEKKYRLSIPLWI